MSSAVLVAIGDELLSGVRREGNAAFLAWRLHDAGWDVLRMEVVPDEEPQIVDVLERWVGKTDLMVLSGGLGPTHDDRTREALARYLGCGLCSDSLYDQIVARYQGGRRELVERSRSTQSMIPEAAQAVYNPLGTALGITFERKGTRVLALPGVPMEYEAMVRQELPELFASSHRWASFIILGVPEPLVVERIPEVVGAKDLHVSVLPDSPKVELIVRGEPERVAEAGKIIRSRFEDILPEGCLTVTEAILHEGRRLGKTVTCVESCTGGLIQGALTATPGMSEIFKGGAVTYSEEFKEKLGVPLGILEEFGPVSSECAEGMARGGIWAYRADFSVSVTGVAGPDGGTPETPVGGVWFGLAARGEDGRARCATFYRLLPGGRQEVRRRAVNLALAELWRTMRDGYPAPLSPNP